MYSMASTASAALPKAINTIPRRLLGSSTLVSHVGQHPLDHSWSAHRHVRRGLSQSPSGRNQVDVLEALDVFVELVEIRGAWIVG